MPKLAGEKLVVVRAFENYREGIGNLIRILLLMEIEWHLKK
jgi:hypothetical protein